MTVTLENDPANPAPPTFLRGTTLDFRMRIDARFAADFFTATGVTATFESKLRRLCQAGDEGFICDLRPELSVDGEWVTFTAKEQDEEEAWVTADTSEWPLGVAEFDLFITRTLSGATKKYRSLPVTIRVKDGVS